MGEFDVRYEKQAPFKIRKVWFNSTSAIKQGYGVCYNQDYAEETKNEEKANVVELPSTTNAQYFAGVTVKAYPAITIGSGQWIDIYEPGGWAYIAIGADTTEESTLLTCSVNTADAGRFQLQGLPGRGSALLRETTTAGVVFSSTDGTATYTNATKTVTKTGIGTASTVGDYIYVVAGNKNNTGTQACTFVETTVATISTDSLTITTALGGDLDGCVVYVTSGNPVALAYLQDGPESGLVQIVSPLNNAAAQSMVGGTTYVCGGITLGGGASTSTLADGLWNGQRKAFVGLGTLTTSGYTVTITSGITSGKIATNDVFFPVATATINEADEYFVLEWMFQNWALISGNEASLAANFA